MIHYNLDEIQQGFRLLTTTINETIQFKGSIIYELDAGYCFKGDITPSGYESCTQDTIDIYNYRGKIILVFLERRYALEVTEVRVLKGELVGGFDGFEKNKEFKLKNGQIWKQEEDLNLPDLYSEGIVRIIDTTFMVIDRWDYAPRVTRIK